MWNKWLCCFCTFLKYVLRGKPAGVALGLAEYNSSGWKLFKCLRTMIEIEVNRYFKLSSCTKFCDFCWKLATLTWRYPSVFICDLFDPVITYIQYLPVWTIIYVSWYIPNLVVLNWDPCIYWARNKHTVYIISSRKSYGWHFNGFYTFPRNAKPESVYAESKLTSSIIYFFGIESVALFSRRRKRVEKS